MLLPVFPFQGFSNEFLQLRLGETALLRFAWPVGLVLHHGLKTLQNLGVAAGETVNQLFPPRSQSLTLRPVRIFSDRCFDIRIQLLPVAIRLFLKFRRQLTPPCRDPCLPLRAEILCFPLCSFLHLDLLDDVLKQLPVRFFPRKRS